MNREQRDRLVKTLLKIPAMANPDTRNDVVNDLPPDIKNSIQRRAALRPDVNKIVEICANFSGGLEELLRVLRESYEGNSLPMQAAERVWTELAAEIAAESAGVKKTSPGGSKTETASEDPSAKAKSQKHTAGSTGASKKIFISYRHVKPDEDLANFLVEYLQGRGQRVFIDNKMLVGSDWVKDIEAHIKNADGFVVLLSQNSILSAMVCQEVKLAYEMTQQPGRSYKIFPVRVSYSGELPINLGSYLNRYQYALWQSGTPFAEIGDQLARAIESSGQLPFAARSEEETESGSGLQELQAVTDFSGAPLPQADPRLLEILAPETGTLSAASPFYVVRATDDELFSQIQKRGTTTLVKGARQMGKSSLLARAHTEAKRQGHLTFYLDFQTIDAGQMATLETLLKYLAYRVFRALKLPIDPAKHWDKDLGAKDNLGYYLEDALLQTSDAAVLLLFDEADQVFNYPYRDDFFAMIRSWHNNRAMEPEWEKLNIVIAHSTEPTLWIQELEQSPFNVGYKIRLPHFTREQVQDLNARHHHPLKTGEEIQGLMDLVGGQPYLVRQALYGMVKGGFALPELQRRALQENGPFGDHLRHFLWRFQGQPELQQSFRGILYRRGCENEKHFQGLRAAGLVKGDTRDSAQVRCKLYEDYFKKHL